MTVKIDGTNTVANPAFTGVDTDTGLQCGTNELKLVTGGSARATVDSSGRLGVGTESPGSWNGGANDLVISGSDNTGLTINATSSTSSSIHFADGSTGSESYRGIIEYNHTLDALQFYTSATKRARIDADGLKFNSDSGAVNALDDYEEGDHACSVTAGTSGTITLSNSTLGYVKIGNLVTVQGRLDVSSVSSPTGELELSLPFANGSGLKNHAAPSVFIWQAKNTEAPNNGLWTGFLGSNTSTLNLRYGDSNTPPADGAAAMQANTEIRIVLTYRTV